MGRDNPLRFPRSEGTNPPPATRADGHLGLPTILPTAGPLGQSDRAILVALMTPGCLGPLPDDRDWLGPEAIVEAAEGAGLVFSLYDNARRSGLDALADAARHAAQRQRFIGRERWHTASRAAERITAATGHVPMALGGIAATELLYQGPESRLRRCIELLVPETAAPAARVAVAELRGVRVVSRVLPGRRRRCCEEALWLRSSTPGAHGWRTPTLEDLVLLSAMDLLVASGPRRMAILSDLRLALGDAHLHWETVVQRANVWRVRVQMYTALCELRDELGVRVSDRALRRLRPTLWERAAELLPRP